MLAALLNVAAAVAAATAATATATAASQASATNVPGASRSPPAAQTAAHATAKSGAAAGCLPDGKGYLRARIRGAVNFDIDWHNGKLACEGSPRSNHQGIRLSFAGPVRPSGQRVRLIFGIAGAGEGRAGRELPTNVTLIFDGERRLFSTRGADKCTIDRLLEERLGPPGGAVRTYRVVARGFCYEPADDLFRNERVVISRFDFAGRVAFP